jgi:hypothetical protein
MKAMAEYKIVKHIGSKDLEKEVFDWSHYQDKSNYRFKDFMNELRKKHIAKRNATYHIFLAKIDKKTNTLQMKKTYGVSKDYVSDNLPKYVLKKYGI